MGGGGFGQERDDTAGASPSSGRQAATEALLGGQTWQDDVGFLYTPQPRRSLVRLTVLALLTLLALVTTVSVVSYRRSAALAGHLRLASVSILVANGAQSSDTRQTWEDTIWPEGYGELTVKGMQQMYRLGSAFRSRYVDELGLLPKDTTSARDSVQVRATALDRTEESALACMMGLFDSESGQLSNMPDVCGCRPQTGDDTHRVSGPSCLSRCMGLNKTFSSKQVPSIEVLPLQYDWLLQQHRVCKGWEKGREDIEKYLDAEHKFRRVFDNAVQFLGSDRLCHYKVENGVDTERVCVGDPLKLRDLEPLYQNLLSAESANRVCPVDVGMNCRQLLASIHPAREFLWNHDFNSANAVKAGGMLMGEILENMKRTIKSQQPNADKAVLPPKMYVYSGEPLNVAALLGTLKAPWFRAPLFGSYVALELWAPKNGDIADEEQWMVNVRSDDRPLRDLPGCQHGYCRFKDFFYAQFWTQALYKEDCELRDSSKPTTRL